MAQPDRGAVVRAWRIILAAAGIGLALFGAFRMVTEVPFRSLLFIGIWMVAALIIHDGILSPLVVTVGWLVRRLVPDRARRFLQVGLIVSGLVTVIAIPMIYLRGSQPAVKAMLLRNYGANLTLIIGTVAVVTLALYAVRVARDRPRVTDLEQ
jgi:type IV secretory pathway VirB3-like protein